MNVLLQMNLFRVDWKSKNSIINVNIVHKKYYNTSKIELVSYEIVETDDTAAYDYDRGTDWEDDGKGDWTSTYRMAAYFQNIESRKIFEDFE
mgnify:CR=1 FL=1